MFLKLVFVELLNKKCRLQCLFPTERSLCSYSIHRPFFCFCSDEKACPVLSDRVAAIKTATRLPMDFPTRPRRRVFGDRCRETNRANGLKNWSERPDLNRRPLDPQSSALPDCATLRHPAASSPPERLHYRSRLRPLQRRPKAYRPVPSSIPRSASSSAKRSSSSALWRSASLSIFAPSMAASSPPEARALAPFSRKSFCTPLIV